MHNDDAMNDDHSYGPKQWLPDPIFADNADLRGIFPDNLVRSLGIRVEATAPWSPDQKGILERLFGSIDRREQDEAQPDPVNVDAVKAAMNATSLTLLAEGRNDETEMPGQHVLIDFVQLVPVDRGADDDQVPAISVFAPRDVRSEDGSHHG